MKFRLFFITLCLINALSGCGQSGKLYLPSHPNIPDNSDLGNSDINGYAPYDETVQDPLY